MAAASGLIATVGEDWRGLRLVSAYRAVLAFAFVVAAVSGRGPHVFGQQDAYLFGFAAWGYLLLVIIFEFLLELRVLGFRPQAHLHALGDLVVLSIIMHASGGPGGGIALLLIISVAIDTILLGGRMGLAYAALATLAALGEALWGVLLNHGEPHFAAAGLMGVALFTITGLVLSLERRAQRLHRLSVHQEREVRYLSSLALQIIEQFEEGVLIVDRDGRIEYINSAARSLLSDAAPSSATLQQSSPSMAEALAVWCRNDGRHSADFIMPGRFRARFQRLDSATGQRALILLTDLRAEDARLQQRKLAALGRLTASIAHEVRNPLSSIRQGAELLEGAASETERMELIGIILRHVDRINGLVSGVLDASRRPQVNLVRIDLGRWLSDFVAAKEAEMAGPDNDVDWHLRVPESLEAQQAVIRFDTAHLWQIMDNLVSNAARHGRSADGRLHLDLIWQLVGADQVRILVCDRGNGIEAETRSQLFEPFFTTHSAGVGLGLFISRELAEANQARLDVDLSHEGMGACFRLDVNRVRPASEIPPAADAQPNFD